MNKPFKNHDQQIEIMMSRGLIINDNEKTKSFLFLNNYYNVVNRYGYLLKQVGHETFLPGSTFQELVRINIFDREIKGIVYSKILEIENNLKSVISYVFSKNNSDKYSYLDSRNFEVDKHFDSIKFSAIMVRTIEKHKNRKGNAICHYHENYNHIPLWVLVNFMSFGNISYLYKIMKQSDQTEVAKFFSDNLNLEFNRNDIRIDSGALTDYINAINDLRNAAAHDECMLSFNYRSTVPYNVTLHKLFSIPKTSPRQNLFNMLIIMRFFLNKNQYNRLYNTTINRCKELERGLSSSASNRVLLLTGFPTNWGRSPKYDTIDFSAI